jgi:hypothetical protein
LDRRELVAAEALAFEGGRMNEKEHKNHFSDGIQTTH